MRAILSATTAVVLATLVWLPAGTAEAQNEKGKRTPRQVVADARAAIEAKKEKLKKRTPRQVVAAFRAAIEAKREKSKLKKRTPDQVVAALRAAIEAQDWDAVASNYAEDAYMIDDQGVLLGQDDILSRYQAYAELFNGVSPTVIQEDVFRDTVRVLYRLDGGWIVVPDAADTFVIEKGLIQVQTSHGLIEFTGPPPDEQ